MRAQALIGAEGFRLTTGSIQGGHENRPPSLPEGMLPDGSLGRGHDLPVLSQRESHIEQ